MHTSTHTAPRKRLSPLHETGGFTLVELLVAMVLMLVILAGIYAIWFGLQRTYSFTDEDMTAQEQARTALNEMVEFIRTARQPDPAPSEDLAVVIYKAEPNSLVCWTDTDRDANHDLELVRFRVDEGTRTLYRDDSQTGDSTFSTANSTRLIGNWVSNSTTKTPPTPLFTYYSGSGAVLDAPVADPTQIRQIAIDLRIDVYQDEAPIAHQLRSVVQPRNLRQY